MQSNSQNYSDGQWQLTPFDPHVSARVTDRLDPTADRRRLNQYACGDRIGGGSNGEIFACCDNSDAASGHPLVSIAFNFLVRYRPIMHPIGSQGSQESYKARQI
jgi:hypothetical protein